MVTKIQLTIHLLFFFFFFISCNAQTDESAANATLDDLSPKPKPDEKVIPCNGASIGQSHTVINGARPFNGGQDFSNLGQTFDLPNDARIGSIDVFLSSTAADISVTLKVFPNPNGGVPNIYQDPVAKKTISDLTGYVGFSKRNWINFKFKSAVDLKAGEYFIDLTSDADESQNENVYVWSNGTIGSDFYVPGKKRRRSKNGYWYDHDTDLGFRVYECQ